LGFEPLLPPPQEHSSISNAIGTSLLPTRNLFLQPASGTNTMPGKTVAQSQPDGRLAGCNLPIIPDVVATETLNGVAVLPFTFTLVGSEQLAPVGAPVQLSVAIPLKPAAPISRA